MQCAAKMYQYGLAGFIGVCLLFANIAFAADVSPHCSKEGLKFFKDWLVLSADFDHQPHIYALKNKTKEAMILDHPQSADPVAKNWTSELAPGHWSAMLVTSPNFALNCYKEQETGVRRVVPCRQVLSACIVPQSALMSGSKTQNAWLIENEKLDTLLAELKSQNIVWLPAHRQQAS